jgi:hypothetical protein
MRRRIDRRKPSAWRSGSWKIRRSVSAVSMATSENRSCAPRHPVGQAVQAAMASGENQSVTSPRRTRLRSYEAQLVTRYFVLYLGWTLDRFEDTPPAPVGIPGYRQSGVGAIGVMHQRPAELPPASRTRTQT